MQRIALAGCGVVGTAFLRELAARAAAIAGRHQSEFEVVGILVRDIGARRDPSVDRALLTNDLEQFLSVDADVVVEAIGGIEPASRIAETTLRRGRRLITANKALIASQGRALAGLAAQHEASLQFDAAVGGGVPVLRVLDDALGGGTPLRVRAILNGTTNFVLTRLEEGALLDDALRTARAAGFAEADATRDLDGRDAADKLSLIAWSAFGVAPEDAAVQVTSLLPDPARFTRLADRLDARVRQVAECADAGGGIVSTVEPLFLARRSAFARTRFEENRIEVDSGWSSPLSASGPGAGGSPTANALLSDLLAAPAVSPRSFSGKCASRDPREHDWVVEVAAPPSALHSHVPNCSLVHTDASATSAWTLVTGARRDAIAELLSRLAQAGADPIAARLDGSATP